MPLIYECSGCHCKLDSARDTLFPQGNHRDKFKEVYCQICNKKYPAYQAAERQALFDIDTKREQIRNELRERFFRKDNAPAPTEVKPASSTTSRVNAFKEQTVDVSSGKTGTDDEEGIDRTP